jgi:hypothetical protein
MALAAQNQAQLAEALLADGPDTAHTEALMLFGQFVGEWDVDWTGYEWDGEQALTSPM